MKGRKTKIHERRLTLIEHLRVRFPGKTHLIDDFLREIQLHPESELWLTYTESGIAAIFLRFLAPPTPASDNVAIEWRDDIRKLQSLAEKIKWIEVQLGSGIAPGALQRGLRVEVLEPIIELNKRWLSSALK